MEGDVYTVYSITLKGAFRKKNPELNPQLET